MKKFLKKRWHSIPVALVSAVLVLALVAGGVFAAYGFLTAALNVEVEEAIAVGTFQTWDNLYPYGSDVGAEWEYNEVTGIGTLGDVEITLGGTAEAPTITISTTAETPYVGEGFSAGEWIVIPLNIRSGSSGELTLGAFVSTGTGGLVLEYLWKENDVGAAFMPSGTWAPLSDWNPTITGPYGESGSAVDGAKVLFVRIRAPGDMVPGTYTFTVTLQRS